MKKLPRFMTQDQFELLPEHMETNSGEQVTVDGMALTGRQLVERYTNGGTFTIAPAGWSPNSDDLSQEDLSKLKYLDLFDLQERRFKIENELEELEQNIKLAEKDALKKAKQAEVPEALTAGEEVEGTESVAKGNRAATNGGKATGTKAKNQSPENSGD